MEHENTKLYIKINKRGMTLFSPEILKNLSKGPKTPVNGSMNLYESDYSRNNDKETGYSNQMPQESAPNMGYS